MTDTIADGRVAIESAIDELEGAITNLVIAILSEEAAELVPISDEVGQAATFVWCSGAELARRVRGQHVDDES